MVTFFERLGAYFVDVLIISLLLGIIGYGLPNNTEDTSKEMSNLDEKFVNKEISTEEYLTEYYGLLYETQSSSKLVNGISLMLSIAYFVIFQVLYNGQTLGKKLFKIKVVDEDKKPVSFWAMLVRYMFIMNILSSVFGILLLFIASKKVYIISYLVLVVLDFLFLIVTTLFVLYRKDKRGLHDLMAKTMVIKEV